MSDSKYAIYLAFESYFTVTTTLANSLIQTHTRTHTTHTGAGGRTLARHLLPPTPLPPPLSPLAPILPQVNFDN
jgi:hypothetical protein